MYTPLLIVGVSHGAWMTCEALEAENHHNENEAQPEDENEDQPEDAGIRKNVRIQQDCQESDG